MKLHRTLLLCAALSLAYCNHYGMLDKLENPGGGASGGASGNFASNFYIFASSWTTPGNMSGSPFPECNALGTGLERADCACQHAASGRGLLRSPTHQFRAWLSVSGPPQQHAICRIFGGATGCTGSLPIAGPYLNTKGHIVAPGYYRFDVFTNGTLVNAVQFDEFGNNLGLSAVWTGTGSNGQDFGVNCLNWTDSSSSFNGQAGLANSFTGTWTQNATKTCDTPNRIYCVASPVF
jgi:hypothetical protein